MVSWAMQWNRASMEYKLKGRLGTIDLLIKVACLVKKNRKNTSNL